ncbi:MAG: tRNA pseudouridine(55) synthase TruB [Chlamydiota bacterium]
MSQESKEGILLVNKPVGKTAFSLVGRLRKLLNIKKIGHAGTLDPFATGVMVMLIGRKYTKLSDMFLNEDKEYVAELRLGLTTETFDTEGSVTGESDYVPSIEEVEKVISKFQGDIEQIPPMFSAKKVDGKKLYELARKGQTVERKPIKVFVETHLMRYEYPVLSIHVTCSKGTYIRTIADDMGRLLGCGAHLTNLERTRSGRYRVNECIEGDKLFDGEVSTDELIDNIQPLFS